MQTDTVVSFTDYWSALPATGKKELADRVFSSVAYLSQVAHGHRSPSKRFAAMVEEKVGQRVEFISCCEG